MGEIFLQAANLTSTFNQWLLLAIFMITVGAEFGLSVPYLLETIWLLTGYQIMGGNLSLTAVVLFCFISLAGREVGAMALYRISQRGVNPFARLLNILAVRAENNPPQKSYRKVILISIHRFLSRFFLPGSSGKARPGSNYWSRFTHPSALGVVLGRFSCLKIPITINLGVNRRLLALLAGVALFSLIWDSLYILLGMFGLGDKLNPWILFSYSLGSLVIINSMLYLIRRLTSIKRLSSV